MSSSSSHPFEDDDRFDGLYMNVAQQARGIDPLLDTVFGFLRRKTDFFAGPPGAAAAGTDGTELAMEKVQQVMERHVKRYLAEQSGKSSSKKKAKPTAAPPSSITSPKKAKSEPTKKEAAEDVIEMGNDGGFDVSEQTTPVVENPSPPHVPSASSDAKPIKAEEPPKSKNETAEPAKPSNEDDDMDEDTAKKAPPVGNGGTVPGKYVWTQTLAEVTVNIPVPDNTRGRDLNVVIAKKKLKVGLRGAKEMIIEEAALCKPIIVDDSFWTVEDGNRLVVNLQKSNQMEWWDCVVQGDPTIDVKTIQPENSSLGDLDGETRKTVEKMMFDQRQKALGLPSSDEQQKLDVLQRFQKEHPELDFSNVKIT